MGVIRKAEAVLPASKAHATDRRAGFHQQSNVGRKELGLSAAAAAGKSSRRQRASPIRCLIVAKPGIKSLKELKGKKVGIEVGFVEHLLLLLGLQSSGMKEKDVKLVNAKTNETPTDATFDKAGATAWPASSPETKVTPISPERLLARAESCGGDLKSYATEFSAQHLGG